MSKKTNAKHWYQVNKLKAGADAVSSSIRVKSAREAVLSVEHELNLLKISTSSGLGATFRRAFIGKSPSEILIEGLEKRRLELKRLLEMEIANVSQTAQRTYGGDWAKRNPELAKKTEKKI